MERSLSVARDFSLEVLKSGTTLLWRANCWRQVQSKEAPPAYRNAATRALNSLQGAFPEGLSDQLEGDLRDFINLCALQGALLNRLAHELQDARAAWRERQKRPLWRQYLLDVSPYEWTCYFVGTRLLEEPQINPIVIPAVEIDRTTRLYELACSHMGKCFFFLMELRRALEERPLITPEELEKFIGDRLRLLLANFQPNLTGIPSDDLFSTIESHLLRENENRGSFGALGKLSEQFRGSKY